MGNAVGRANGECAVEHASDEDEPIALIPREILPVPPHKVIRGIWEPIDLGHYGADHDTDENASNDKEATHGSSHGKDLVSKQNDQAAEPGTYDIADEDVPRLYFKLGMEHGIHRHCLIGENRGDGRGSKDPGKEVPPSSEVATNASILSSSDGCPMVYYSAISGVQVWRCLWALPPLEDGMAEASSASDAAISQ